MSQHDYVILIDRQYLNFIVECLRSNNWANNWEIVQKICRNGLINIKLLDLVGGVKDLHLSWHIAKIKIHHH